MPKLCGAFFPPRIRSRLTYTICSMVSTDHLPTREPSSMFWFSTILTRCSVASCTAKVCLQMSIWFAPWTTCVPTYRTGSYFAPTIVWVTSPNPVATFSGRLQAYISTSSQPPVKFAIMYSFPPFGSKQIFQKPGGDRNPPPVIDGVMLWTLKNIAVRWGSCPVRISPAAGGHLGT